MLPVMLDAVLEYELVGARFRPIVRLITAERVAHRLERAAHTDLFPGWPAIGADQLLALARDVGRWAFAGARPSQETGAELQL